MEKSNCPERKEESGEKRPRKSPGNTALAGPSVGQVGERRTANQVTSLASRIYVGPAAAVGERRGAYVARKKRKRDRAKGGGRSPAQYEPLLSGTSARRRVQVVSCSFSTFLHAIAPFRRVFPAILRFSPPSRRSTPRIRPGLLRKRVAAKNIASSNCGTVGRLRGSIRKRAKCAYLRPFLR